MVLIRKRTALLLAGALLLLATGLTLTHALHIEATAQPGGEAVPLPIIMYHSILKASAAQGKYVVSPAVLETDMQYLQENGYTTVSIAELTAYVEKGQPLPEKPVILSFDDGNLNNLSYVVPLLEKYDMKAVISVVGEFVEKAVAEDDPNPAYAYLTWEEICQVLASGHVEIGNHTFALHNSSGRRGAAPLKGESKEQYQKLLRDDLQELQNCLEAYCGVEPLVFTYPYGFVHRDSLPVVQEVGFKASFGCSEKINYITRDPACLFCLGRYNRPAGLSTAAFMKKALH